MFQGCYQSQWNPPCTAVQPLCICNHGSCTICTFAEAFFSGCCLNTGNFQHWYYSLSNPEINSILPEIWNITESSAAQDQPQTNNTGFQCETCLSEHRIVVNALYYGKLLLCLSLHFMSCVNLIHQENRFGNTSDQSWTACVINSNSSWTFLVAVLKCVI